MMNIIEYFDTMDVLEAIDAEVELLDALTDEDFDFDGWATERGIDLDMTDEHGIPFLQRWWWRQEE